MMFNPVRFSNRFGLLMSGVAAAAFLFAAMPAEAASKDSHNDSSSHAQGAGHDGQRGGAGGQRKGKGGSSIGRGGGHKSLRDVFQDMVDETDSHGLSDAATTDHGGAKQKGKKVGSGSQDKKSKKPSTTAVDADEPEDSDRPEWAGTPGKDGKPGKPNTESGSKKGDLFGDMYVLLRDDNGVPILTAEGWVQPVDSEGNPLELDEEGHLVDEDAAIEVELGRLNVGRSPERVLSVRYEEALDVLNSADSISLDATGRITYTIDGVVKTIDSPLENLALYVEIMNTGTLDGIVDTTKFTGELVNLVDGTLTVDDYVDAASFFAAASDKAGSISIDQVVYMNTIVGIDGTLADAYVDYSTFDYDREDVYGDVTVEVLVQQTNGTWLPSTVNVYETVFSSTNYVSDDGGIDGFAQAADDARAVIEFVHEYAVPVTTTVSQ